MQNEINANLLAKMGINQIEEEKVVKILTDQYDAMPCEIPENRDYDRLFAANRLSKANKVILDKFKKAVLELMKGPKGIEPCTITIGTRMFKLYYNTSSNWQKVHLPDLTMEQIENMSDNEYKTEETKRELLAQWQELNQDIADLEKLITPKKLELKGKTEALEALMPLSKCIKRTPVLQVTEI
jgi:hypothetical protein